MLELFSLPFVLLYGALCAITMKIADLLDEHGLKLFKYADLLFGFLWGGFGALLILSNPVIANVVLAMTIGFLIRMRIDYVNHAIAVTIIFVTFLAYSSFDLKIFLPFYFVFLIFGGLRDYVGDVLKKTEGPMFMLNELMLHYPVSTLIYATLYGNWNLFFVFTIFTASYDLTKYYAAKRGYK